MKKHLFRPILIACDTIITRVQGFAGRHMWPNLCLEPEINTMCRVGRARHNRPASVTLPRCGHSGVSAAFCTPFNGPVGILHESSGDEARQRAGRRRIARFKRRMRKIQKKAGKEWTVGVEDEAIVVADSRPRKGVCTLGNRRAVYTYNGSHTKTIVFGFITADGGGFFKRYAAFTKEEFVDFLKAAHKWFGKTIMVLDGGLAAQGKDRPGGPEGDERRGKAGVSASGLPPT